MQQTTTGMSLSAGFDCEPDPTERRGKPGEPAGQALRRLRPLPSTADVIVDERRQRGQQIAGGRGVLRPALHVPTQCRRNRIGIEHRLNCVAPVRIIGGHVHAGTPHCRLASSDPERIVRHPRVTVETRLRQLHQAMRDHIEQCADDARAG